MNQDRLNKEMDSLKKESTRYNIRDNNRYLLYKQRYGNDTLNDKIIDHGGFVHYYTEDKVPVPIINKLSGAPNSEVVYKCKKHYDLESVTNVQFASMATQVTLDVPIVLPDINPYDYLFALFPLRYHVDKVKISFPTLTTKEVRKRHKRYYELKDGVYHLKPKYKYNCFKSVFEPLSTWKMNLWLVCDSLPDLKKVEDKIVRDNKRFKRESYKLEEAPQSEGSQ